MDIDKTMKDIHAAVTTARECEITWERGVKEKPNFGLVKEFQPTDGVTITISINGGA